MFALKIYTRKKVVLSNQYSVWVNFLLKTNQTMEIYIPNIVLGTEKKKNTEKASKRCNL